MSTLHNRKLVWCDRHGAITACMQSIPITTTSETLDDDCDYSKISQLSIVIKVQARGKCNPDYSDSASLSLSLTHI